MDINTEFLTSPDDKEELNSTQQPLKLLGYGCLIVLGAIILGTGALRKKDAIDRFISGKPEVTEQVNVWNVVVTGMRDRYDPNPADRNDAPPVRAKLVIRPKQVTIVSTDLNGFETDDFTVVFKPLDPTAQSFERQNWVGSYTISGNRDNCGFRVQAVRLDVLTEGGCQFTTLTRAPHQMDPNKLVDSWHMMVMPTMGQHVDGGAPYNPPSPPAVKPLQPKAQWASMTQETSI